MLIWPSALRAGSSTWLRKSSMPPSVPPVMSFVTLTAEPLVLMMMSLRVGSYAFGAVVTVEAAVPTTSGWPLPM